MTQEDKELLLIDICARWPYNNLIVRVTDINDPSYDEEGKLRDIKHMDIDCNGIPFLFDVENVFTLCDITEIKPYLRPMSSMTEDERKELVHLVVYVEGPSVIKQIKDGGLDIMEGKYQFHSLQILDWLNKKGFDYRGLLEKGLALPALKNMYK